MKYEKMEVELGGTCSVYGGRAHIIVVGSSIVSGYGLDDRAIEVRSPAEAEGFLL
jgi:hypothetical protein